jgi:hypothetical protein
MAGASVLADGLTRDFTDRGFTPIVGQTARNPADLATLAQVYRDPRVETLRLFVMKGDRIVAQTGVAQRMPGSVTFGPGQFQEWKDFIAANGGDGYYLLHNHPNGKAAPSTADRGMTAMTIRQIPGFRAHVIVDHNQFGVISAKYPDGVYEKDFKGYDPGKNPRQESEWLGKLIVENIELARLASGVGAKPNEITVITTDNENRVKSITSFPKDAFEMFDRKRKTTKADRLKFWQAAARIKRLRAASGSSGYVFAVAHNATDLKDVWTKGLFTDVVDLSTGQAMGSRWQAVENPMVGDARVQGHETVRNNLGRSKVAQVAEPTNTYELDAEGQPTAAAPAGPAGPIPSHVDAGGGHYTTAPLSGVSPEVTRIVLDVMAAEDTNIKAQRGGEMPITWDQTDAESVELLNSEFGATFNSLVNRIPRSTANAAMLKSFAKIVNAAGKNVKAAVDRYNATQSAQDLAHLSAAREQLGVALAPFMGYRTEAGRALNILKQVQAEFADAQAIFELLGDGNVTAVQDFARKVKQAGSVAEIIAITQASYKPTFLDQFREYWMNLGLLSGPWTHLVNLSSTWAYNLVESGVELATSVASPNVSTRSALKRFSGMLGGVQMGIANAGKAFSTEQPQLSQQAQIDSAKYRAIPGKIGRAVRIPGRALMAEDEFNKAIAYSGELSRLAMDESQRTGRPFDEVLRGYGADREKQAEARKWAERQTFQTPLGAFGREGMRFRDRAQLWFLIPFVRTPTNIVKRFAEYTPAGMTMPSVLADLKAGGRAGALAKGRMIIGSASMAAIASLVLRGMMTGAGPEDEEERALWMQTGRKPYSILVNGKWYRYNRFEPLGMLFGVAADISEMSRTLTGTAPDKFYKASTQVLASLMTNLGDKTFLRGITEFMQAYTDPERYGEQWVSNLAATVAVPNIAAQAARAKDPYVRDARNLMDTIRARVPGIRESLPAKLDVSGQPINRSLVEPLAATPAVDDPLAEAMLRLGASKGAPSRTFTIKGRTYELTPEEYEGYKGFVQQSRWKVLTPIVNSPQFRAVEEQNAFKAKDGLENLYDKVGRQARDVWLIQHPEIIKKMATQSVPQPAGSAYLGDSP